MQFVAKNTNCQEGLLQGVTREKIFHREAIAAMILPTVIIHLIAKNMDCHEGLLQDVIREKSFHTEATAATIRLAGIIQHMVAIIDCKESLRQDQDVAKETRFYLKAAAVVVISQSTVTTVAAIDRSVEKVVAMISQSVAVATNPFEDL